MLAIRILPGCYTVRMLEMVLRLQTHDLWNAKTSGVVRNVGIIVDGTERWPRGLLLHMASLLMGVETGGWEEAGRGLFRHSCARIGETWLIDSEV